MARKMQVNIFKKEDMLKMCILYIVTGGLLFLTPGCYATGEAIKPHRVIYTPHVPYYDRPHYRRYIHSYRPPRRIYRRRFAPAYRHHDHNYKHFYKKHYKKYRKYNKQKTYKHKKHGKRKH